MVLLIGLAGLAWRLSSGPISIDFLAPYIAESISVDGEVSFSVRRAVLSWDGIERSPQIRILDITAIDEGGQVVGVFPEMNVRLSLLSVLEGSPAPQDITLTNPIVRVTRRLDGSVFLGLDPNNSGNDVGFEEQNEPIEQEQSSQVLVQLLIRALSSPGDSTNLPGYLDSAAIENASIVFLDRKTGLEWLVPSGRIELLRDENGVIFQARLPYLSEGETSEVLLSGAYEREDNSLSLTFTFEKFNPSLLAELFPETPFVSGIDLEVSGILELDVLLNVPTPTIKKATLDIVRGEGVISLPAPIQRQYPLTEVTIKATAEQSLDQIVVQELELTLEGEGDLETKIKLALRGFGLNSRPEITAQIDMDSLALLDLQRYWPEAIKPNTLKWIQGNLRNGIITNARFDAGIEGESLLELGVVQFEGRADLDDFQVTYMRNMPPVENVSGELFLGLSEVSIDVTGGEVIDLRTGGALGVESGRVRLHDLDKRPQMADIDLIINGDLRDAMSLIDEEPLQYASKLGISPLSTSGKSEVLLGFDFPLIQELGLDQVEVSAQAKIENASIDKAAFDLPLEAGQFSLTLNNAGMDVVGTTSLGGIRAGLTWRENFSDAQYRRQYAVDAVVENDQRHLVRLGSEFFQPPYIDGPVRIEAIYTVGLNGLSNLSLEADLQESLLSLPQLNWSKPVGNDALLSAEIKFTGQALNSIDGFSIHSETSDLNVAGSAQFFDNSKLARLTLDQGVIGQSNFGLRLERETDDVLNISMDGAVLDGSTFWTSLRQSDQSRAIQVDNTDNTLPVFRFSGEMDRLILSEDGGLSEVSAQVTQLSSGISDIFLSGSINETESFQLTLKTEDDVRRFQAQSDNGGGVLYALGLGDDFIAGDLFVTGNIMESGAVDGVFNMGSFRLVDAPLLARLLSVASLTGIVDELNGGGISFSELNLPFSFSESVFSIENGAMYGSSLGLTARGSYYISQDVIEGEGTLIPAYAVNSAMGSIPILGPLLTGGEKSGGVFAATYSIRGNPDGGEVTVNPLATLTPGFLRQIFKVFDPPPAKPSDSIE